MSAKLAGSFPVAGDRAARRNYRSRNRGDRGAIAGLLIKKLLWGREASAWRAGHRLRFGTSDDCVVFFFQLSVSPIGFHQSAALFFQALFEITDLLLETNRHPRHSRCNGIAQLNFGLTLSDVCLSSFP